MYISLMYNHIYLLHRKLDDSKYKFIFMMLMVIPMPLLSVCDMGNLALTFILLFITFITIPIAMSRVLYITGSLKFDKHKYGELPQVGDVYVVRKKLTYRSKTKTWDIEQGHEIKVVSILSENNVYDTKYFFLGESTSGSLEMIDYIEYRKNLMCKSDHRNKKINKIIGY